MVTDGVDGEGNAEKEKDESADPDGSSNGIHGENEGIEEERVTFCFVLFWNGGEFQKPAL